MANALRIGCVVAVLYACLAAAACQRATPEQQLRDTVDGLQQAIDERDAGDVARTLAADFVGNDGLDREAARRMATAMFLQHRQVGARLGPLEVRMTGDAHAKVEFTAALTGGSGGWLPDSGQVYRVRTGWRIEDGEWRMSSAQWQPQL
jgi:hypothetical protein